ESEARLRIATTGAALGIFEWDTRANRAVWENDRMYEIFGRTRADGPLSRKQFVDSYLHPNDANSFEKALKVAMDTRGSFHTICRIRRKDGARRWLQFDGKFAATGTGDPSRLLGVVADVTARKTLERQTERLSQRIVRTQEEERRKIAQELHDSTVQQLVAASLTLMRLRPSTTCAQESLWSDLETSLEEAMKELRTFSYLMHPPAPRMQGLCSALRRYIDGFASRSGLDVRLRARCRIDKIPLAMQQSLFGIVQEALANVYRHASAAHISVELRRIGKQLHLIITDDGRAMTGFRAFRPGPS